MKTDLKIGDRVDIKMIIKETWEHDKGLSNGVLKGVREYKSFKSYYVSTDEKSKGIDYHSKLHSGHYSDAKYLITKTN